MEVLLNMCTDDLTNIQPPIETIKYVCGTVVDVGECKSYPCQNGATCSNEVNGYTCSCLPGYEGVDCEISKYRTQQHRQLECNTAVDTEDQFNMFHSSQQLLIKLSNIFLSTTTIAAQAKQRISINHSNCSSS